MAEQALKVMQCMEVWGGNCEIDRAVVMPGVDVWVYSRPCGDSREGGDVHYLSTCAAGWFVRMMLADVSGHGDAVGSVAGGLRDLMRRYINDHDHTRFVRSLNEEFTESTAANIFATAVALTFDSPENALQICNAGHPAPLRWAAAEEEWIELEAGEAGNVPLGILGGVSFSQMRVVLEPGDLVFCFTDGFVEALGEDGEMLGAEGLRRLVARVWGEVGRPEELIGGVVRELARMSVENLGRDDLSCLLIRPNGTRPEVPLVDWMMGPVRTVAAKFGVRFGWVGQK